MQSSLAAAKLQQQQARGARPYGCRACKRPHVPLSSSPGTVQGVQVSALPAGTSPDWRGSSCCGCSDFRFRRPEPETKPGTGAGAAPPPHLHRLRAQVAAVLDTAQSELARMGAAAHDPRLQPAAPAANGHAAHPSPSPRSPAGWRGDDAGAENVRGAGNAAASHGANPRFGTDPGRVPSPPKPAPSSSRRTNSRRKKQAKSAAVAAEAAASAAAASAHNGTGVSHMQNGAAPSGQGGAAGSRGPPGAPAAGSPKPFAGFGAGPAPPPPLPRPHTAANGAHSFPQPPAPPARTSSGPSTSDVSMQDAAAAGAGASEASASAADPTVTRAEAERARGTALYKAADWKARAAATIPRHAYKSLPKTVVHALRRWPASSSRPAA